MAQHFLSIQFRDWLIPAGFLLFGAVGIAAMTLPAPSGAETVAAVFPPWWSEQRIYGAIAVANAEPVRLTALSSVVVLRPAPAQGRARLREAGAWFAADPRAVAACLQ